MAKVTVLMPVYNGEQFLNESIKSILSQTYKDFELLIIDDGSTDNSVKVIKSFQDSRIRLVHNENNLKLISTLNKGIRLSKGDYIARMDCDDISLPERMERQFKFLENNSKVGVCGTWLRRMDKNSIWKAPLHHDEIKCSLLFNSCIYHPTVMIRKNILNKFNLFYNEDAIHAEDYDLWVRLAQKTNLANLPEPLLFYRMHKNQIGKVFYKEQLNTTNKIRLKQIHYLGIEPTKEEFHIHRLLTKSKNQKHLKLLKQKITDVEKWIDKLLQKNNKIHYFNQDSFKKILSNFLIKIKKQ
ncbi:glycosyltransferase [Alkalihalobacillus sp. BA299]|uniref:glycosyltransferase n=1 Tax=Alkalihalobacillus sp. BA299 TaxID=2815938 RepID=UPI001ADB47E5|nr:glycosyltransferase [Alkalihalobacillus sp. BA299]